MFGRWSRWAAAAVLVAATTGCTKGAYEQRYGPGPVMMEDDVETTLKRQHAVMEALKNLASTENQPPRGVWYEATLLGFNYVDEECATYLRLNFQMTRAQKRDAGVLDVLRDNTSGLLKAAQVADPTITTVAAAFGAGSQILNAWFDSYLFGMSPDLVFRIVTKLQNSYRTQVEAQKDAINSSAVAYRTIQNYYSLCFPQTIEAKVSEYVAKAGTDDAGSTDTGQKASATQKTATAPNGASSSTSSVTTVDPQLTTSKR